MPLKSKIFKNWKYRWALVSDLLFLTSKCHNQMLLCCCSPREAWKLPQRCHNVVRMPCCVTSWGFLEGLLAFLCLAQQSGLSPPLNYYTWLTSQGLSVTFKSTLPLSMQFPFWNAILCGLIFTSVPHMKMYPLVARFQRRSSYVGDVSMNQALWGYTLS